MLPQPRSSSAGEPQDTTLPAAPPAADAGGAPPGYELRRELGRGGMGVVYEARQVALNRVVALKMILAGTHASEEGRQRFLAEAKAVAAVQHPGIVQVYDYGTHAGLPYFALELCSGGSLAERLQGTPLPAPDAADLVRQLALAVQAAHDKGIVHRDLKPANVLLASGGREPPEVASGGRPPPEAANGERLGPSSGGSRPPLAPKLTDFGLAKRVEASGLTQTGAIMGTPSYMAPEQAQGSKEVGPPADVYALGALLYECLTGRPPFRAATTFDTILQVVGEEPVPPRALNPQLPRDLETICLKCLQKSPDRRYARAAALAEDLARWQRGEPVLARPVGPLDRAWRWCRRNPAVAALLTAVFLVLTAGIAGSSILAVRARQEQVRADTEAGEAATQAQRAVDAAGVAKENEQKANQARRDAEDRIVRLHVATALRLVDEGDLLGALPWLAEALRNERDPRRTRLHRLRFAAVLRHCPRLVNLWTTNAYEFVCSPDGRHVLTRSLAGDRTHIVAHDTFTGQALHAPLWVTLRTAMRFSPDGERYLTLEEAAPRGVVLRLRDTRTGKVVGPALEEPVRNFSAGFNATFTTDGKRLMTVRAAPAGKAVVRLWELASGRDVTPAALRDTRPELFLRSMAADRLATVTNVHAPRQMEVRLWSLLDGKSIGEPLRPEHDPTDKPKRFAGAFAPDGSRLMMSIGKVGTVYDLTEGKPVQQSFRIRTPEDIYSAEMFPGGARLVTITSGATHWWDARTGSLLRTWRRGREVEEEVDFSDDGRLALFHARATNRQREQARAWDWRADQPISPLLRHAAPIASLKFAPDGRRLFTLHRGEGDLTRGEVCLWDLMPAPAEAVRDAAAPLGCWTDRLGRACLSPDGRRVVALAKGGVRVHDTATGKPLSGVFAHELMGAAFSPDGRFLLLASYKPRQVRVYDLTTSRALAPPVALAEQHEIIADAAVSADGAHFVLVRVQGKDDEVFKTLGYPPSIELFNAAKGTRVAQLMAPVATQRAVVVKNISFTPDGRRVAAVVGQGERDGSGGLRLPIRFEVHHWDIAGGARPARIVSTAMTQQGFTHFFLGQWARQQRYLAFSGDGQRLALSFGGARAYLGPMASEKGPLLELPHQSRVGLVAFSPDGRRVLTASDDQTARLWIAATGKPASPPMDHGSPVKYAAFDPRGQFVATIGGDGSARVWDAETGSAITPRLRAPGAKEATADHETVQAAFDAEGTRLLLISAGRIWSYDLRPDDRDGNDLMRLAELLSGRRIDESGALMPLDTASLRRAWDHLIARYPNGAGVGRMGRDELLAWHRQQVEGAATEEDWTAMAHHAGQLVRARPRDGAAWKRRGEAHARLGLHQLALSDYRRATSLDAKDAVAWHGSGRALAGLGRHADAVTDYGKALAAGAGDGRLHADRGDAHARLERWKEASEDFAHAVRRLPDDPAIWYRAALASLAGKDTSRYHAACAWFTRRFVSSPSGSRARQAAWVCALGPAKDNFTTALSAYPRAAKMRKEDAAELFRAMINGVRDLQFEARADALLLDGEPDHGGSAHSPLTANAALCYRLELFPTAELILTKGAKGLADQVLRVTGSKEIADLPEATRRSLGLDGSPWNDLLLAMAYQRQNRAKEAKAALAGAIKRLEALQGKLDWPERLELRLLRAEAEQLIAPKPGKAKGRP